MARERISSAANAIVHSVNETKLDKAKMFLTPFLVIFFATIAFLAYARHVLS